MLPGFIISGMRGDCYTEKEEVYLEYYLYDCFVGRDLICSAERPGSAQDTGRITRGRQGAGGGSHVDGSMLFTAAVYSFIGFLFNAITPSASGGQPMQVLYMNMDGINMGASSVALLFWTILYKLVLLVMEGFFLLWKQDFLLQALGRYQWLYWIGILVNAVSIILYGLIVFSKNGAKKIVRMATWLLYRLHIVKRRERLLCKLDVLLDAYQEGAVYMRTHLDTAVIVFGITLLQRLSYFMVTWFVLCSLGVQAGSMGDIVILQSLVSVCIDILPFPGGVGVNESFFVTIFRPFVGQSRAFSTMLLSRGVSFYALLLISAIITFGTQIYHMSYGEK